MDSMETLVASLYFDELVGKQWAVGEPTRLHRLPNRYVIEHWHHLHWQYFTPLDIINAAWYHEPTSPEFIRYMLITQRPIGDGLLPMQPRHPLTKIYFCLLRLRNNQRWTLSLCSGASVDHETVSLHGNSTGKVNTGSGCALVQKSTMRHICCRVSSDYSTGDTNHGCDLKSTFSVTCLWKRLYSFKVQTF